MGSGSQLGPVVLGSVFRTVSISTLRFGPALFGPQPEELLVLASLSLPSLSLAPCLSQPELAFSK